MEVRPSSKKMTSALNNSGLSHSPEQEETILSDIHDLTYIDGSNKGPNKIPTTFRIDKDELMTGMNRIRTNVLRLVAANGDGKRRRLIVDLEPPVFRAFTTELAQSLSESKNLGKLNSNQKVVVQKVLTADDYALVLGMPGTGKTTTISTLVKILVSQGKSVLLTSYTHSAIDNILLKLKDSEEEEESLDIIRLGNRDKIHPAILRYTPAEADLKTVRQTDQYYMSKPIVATTCLGITHPLFSKRRFDYCIVDEATQITLPVCLGPLRCADVFILVGDHYQLPPLVRNMEAKKGGLADSLFKYLCKAHPTTITSLEYQYRMSSDIQSLANHLTYDYKLKCGTTKVANGNLKLEESFTLLRKDWQVSAGLTSEQQWLEKAINPCQPVVFLDTDVVPAYETRNGADFIHNSIEVQLVTQLTTALLHLGVQGSQLGVVSPYRAQLQQLESAFSKVAYIPKTLEIHTIDRFQGRDKEVIIMSWVRSNDQNSAGRLLRDWRRINVAVTRAKHKLIMVGSFTTLRVGSGIKILDGFCSTKRLGCKVAQSSASCIRDSSISFIISTAFSNAKL